MIIDRDAPGVRTAKPAKGFSYVNRKGDTYFLHQGTSKLGKPRYFFSRSSDGCLSEIPAGFAVTESINAVVSLSRPRAAEIPSADLQVVSDKVAACRHLANHRVESKGCSILIYAPVGQDLLDNTKPEEFSILASFKPFLDTIGRDGESFLSKIALDAGVTVEQIKQMDAEVSKEKRDQFTVNLRKTMQYDPVMRFVLDKRSGQYRIDRRCYRDEEDWLTLGVGSIKSLAAKFVRHIGKESFFDLY